MFYYRMDRGGRVEVDRDEVERAAINDYCFSVGIRDSSQANEADMQAWVDREIESIEDGSTSRIDGSQYFARPSRWEDNRE